MQPAEPLPGPPTASPAATVPELLERAATLSAAGLEAGLRLRDRQGRIDWVPWHRVAAAARGVAERLVGLGLAPGERVALVYPTGAPFFEAFFGVLLAGAVPTPLYPPVRLARLDEYHRTTARLLRAVSARLVLADRRVRRILGEAVAAAAPELGCLTLGELPTPGSRSLPAIGGEELGLVQFSSGTTLEPKPVALTHRALLAQVRLLNSFWPDTPEVRHRGVSWLPLYHDMGLVGCVLPALERPGILTLLAPEHFVVEPASWLRAISESGGTISPAPNFAFGLCVERIRERELEGVDLSSWRVALTGAEPIAPEVLRAFVRRFSRCGLRPEALTPVYGLSEAALAVTFSPPERSFRTRYFDRRALAEEGTAVACREGVELVSVGGPLPGFAVQVVDRAGRGVEEGRLGRVQIRGPSLMEGYLDRPDATRRVLRQGWLDSGDLGFFHEGELYLQGRVKDVVILRGRNYAPEPIEQLVSGLERVRSGCVVAASFLAEGEPGESLHLFVETRRGARVAGETGAALAAEIERRLLAALALSAEVHLLAPGTLPRTTSGKLRRGETVRRFRQGSLAPPPGFGPLRLAAAMVRSRAALRRLDGRRHRGDGGS